jgi:hypothetical protein
VEVVPLTLALVQRAVPAALLAGALVLCACQPGDPNAPPPPRFYLEGSLTQLMDLGYDEARIDGTSQDIALTFVRIKPLDDTLPDGGSSGMTGTTEDYPLKITYFYENNDGGVPANSRVDLAEIDPNTGAQRGTLSRNVLNDPRKMLPPIIRGTLYFDRFPSPDTDVYGDFHVTFENGIEAASGRTVFGEFRARVQP